MKHKKNEHHFGVAVVLSVALLSSLLLTACSGGSGAAASSAPVEASQPTESMASQPTESATSQPASSAASQPVAGGAGLDAAMATAMEHAGVADADVTFSNAHTEMEDGVQVVEVLIVTHDTVYNYVISAQSGEIIEAEQGPNTNFETDGAPTGDYIGTDEALRIALEHAGFTQDEVQVTKTKLDDDDGIMIYEVEFTVNRQDYDYDINATTGEVIKYEVDTAD